MQVLVFRKERKTKKQKKKKEKKEKKLGSESFVCGGHPIQKKKILRIDISNSWIFFQNEWVKGVI